MQRYRTVIILVLLIVVPLAVAVVAARFLLPGNADRTVQPEAEPAKAPVKQPARHKVIAAARALPVGTLLAEIDLTEVDVDGDELQAGQLIVDKRTTPAALRGHAVREPVASGAPLTWSMIVGPGQRGFLAAALGPGTRAVTIRLGEGTRFAGLIDPGDRVDVILTAKLPLSGGAETVVARTILEDVRVVAVDRQVLSGTNSSEAGEKVKRGEIVTATLEVSPEEADRLALGEREGTLALAVRSLEASRRVRSRTVQMEELVALPAAKEAPETPVTASPPVRRVFLAARELSPGTFLRREHLAEIELAPSKIRYGEIAVDAEGSDALRGHVVREPVAAGARLTRSALLAPGQRGFLAAVLKPGTRAITVRLDDAARLAGLIGAGDRVDVILTAKISVGGSSPKVVTRRIVEDVRVVAIDSPRAQRSGSGTDSETDGAKALTATLEVLPSQADRLALAQHEGAMSLAVRSIGESSRNSTDTDAVDLSELLSLPPEKEDEARNREPEREKEDPETQQSILAPEKKVLVIRGSEHTEHVFSSPGGEQGPAARGARAAGPRPDIRFERSGSGSSEDGKIAPE